MENKDYSWLMGAVEPQHSREAFSEVQLAHIAEQRASLTLLLREAYKGNINSAAGHNFLEAIYSLIEKLNQLGPTLAIAHPEKIFSDLNG